MSVDGIIWGELEEGEGSGQKENQQGVNSIEKGVYLET